MQRAIKQLVPSDDTSHFTGTADSRNMNGWKDKSSIRLQKTHTVGADVTWRV